MQNLLIEVSYEDQVFVEDICLKKGYNLSTFFKMLLEKYKESERVCCKEEENTTKEEEKSQEKPKRGRKKKVLEEDDTKE